MTALATWWGSACAGCLLGLLYAVLSIASARFALRVQSRRFVVVVLGGMLGRMAIALGAVIVAVQLFSIHMQSFFIAFFALLVLGTATEAWWLFAHTRKRYA